MVARPRPPRGAPNARVVSTAPAPDRDERRESVRAGRREGEGWPSMGWQVEAGVQSSMGRPKLFDMYKIGYADSNGVIDERGLSWRARPKPVWAP